MDHFCPKIHFGQNDQKGPEVSTFWPIFEAPQKWVKNPHFLTKSAWSEHFWPKSPQNFALQIGAKNLHFWRFLAKCFALLNFIFKILILKNKI